MWRYFGLAVFLASLAGVPALADSQDLSQQVRAAQLVSDLVTYSVDQGDARLSEIQKFLQKAGKANDTATARQLPPQPKHLNYMDIFRGALVIVKDGKDPDGGQSIKRMSDSELYETLTRSQFYNMHEFMHFNQQRDQFNLLMDYLKSAGLLDQFNKESGAAGESAAPAERVNNQASTQPNPSAPQSVADRMLKLMDEMKESAWQKAQTSGMSRSQFDSQWPQQLADYRNTVEDRVEGFQSQASNTKSEAAGTPPPTDQSSTPAGTGGASVSAGPIGGAPGGTSVAVAPTPNTATAPPSPSLIQPAVQSPYSNQTYQARDYSLWNRFDDNDYGRRR